MYFKYAKRWPVIKGKDPCEAFQSGLDIRSWIIAGLPCIQLQGLQRTLLSSHYDEASLITPALDHNLIVADYSQIELGVIAQISGEQKDDRGMRIDRRKDRTPEFGPTKVIKIRRTKCQTTWHDPSISPAKTYALINRETIVSDLSLTATLSSFYLLHSKPSRV